MINVKRRLCETCIKVNMNKVVTKVISGSVVTLTMLGGITIYPPVPNFLQCICQKLCKLVGSGQSYCNNKGGHFYWTMM